MVYFILYYVLVSSTTKAEILAYLFEIWKYSPKIKFKFIDEGNWRNDYPDEDEGWSDSSQDRKYYEDYGFDSGELTSKLV